MVYFTIDKYLSQLEVPYLIYTYPPNHRPINTTAATVVFDVKVRYNHALIYSTIVLLMSTLVIEIETSLFFTYPPNS